MLDSFRPRKEHTIVAGQVAAHFHVIRLKGYELALAGASRLDHEHFDARVRQLTYAHVADLEHEAQLAVSFRDDRIVREDDGSFALVRSRDLGEHHARHETLNEDAEARLQHEEHDGEGALFGDVAQAVADRVLRLDRVQQSRREVVYAMHARHVSVLGLLFSRGVRARIVRFI